MSPDDPPSPLTVRDLLLDDPTRLEAALDAVISDDHDAIGPAGGVAGMSFVRAQAAQTIGDLLAALEVEELLLGAWMTLGELRTAIDETRRDGRTRRVQEAEHRITSAHSPGVDLVVNEKPVPLLELAVEVAADTPERVVGDPNRLRQIVLNLVGNAIKFTDVGHVRVSVGPGAEVHGAILLSVTDTGIGLTPPQMDRLFQSFSQADVSTARRSRLPAAPASGWRSAAAWQSSMGGTITVASPGPRRSRNHLHRPEVRPELVGGRRPPHALHVDQIGPTD